MKQCFQLHVKNGKAWRDSRRVLNGVPGLMKWYKEQFGKEMDKDTKKLLGFYMRATDEFCFSEHGFINIIESNMYPFSIFRLKVCNLT